MPRIPPSIQKGLLLGGGAGVAGSLAIPSFLGTRGSTPLTLMATGVGAGMLSSNPLIGGLVGAGTGYGASKYFDKRDTYMPHIATGVGAGLLASALKRGALKFV